MVKYPMFSNKNDFVRSDKGVIPVDHAGITRMMKEEAKSNAE